MQYKTVPIKKNTSNLRILQINVLVVVKKDNNLFSKIKVILLVKFLYTYPVLHKKSFYNVLYTCISF